MKKLAVFLLVILIVSSLTSCAFDVGDVLSQFMGSDVTNGVDNPSDTNPAVTPDAPSDTPSDEPSDKPSSTDPWDAYETISIAQAIEICMSLDPGTVTEETYYIKATLDSITNATYGAMIITDGEDSISVYNCKGVGDIDFSLLSTIPFKGDDILLSCTLQNYNGTPEIKQAILIDMKKGEVSTNDGDYTEKTIAEARDAAKGEKVKLSGIVAQITYANGKKPSGYILVDNTSSIYVYDSNGAQYLKIGSSVTVIGEKDYWILEDEKNNASKFGYSGCCQISSATLLSYDSAVTDVDFSWVTESSMKDILETPFSDNSTSLVYKVTAMVSKVEGTGFTNYYFNDLDYVDSENPGTGTYAYTQCNGADFAWLDEFDGKLCTVYITALNAKSTASGCNYRVLPIAVEAIEDFAFAASDVPAHVIKYYAKDQFLSSYSGNPELKLITSVSSALLGFENASISYSSSNTAVCDFTNENSESVLQCLSAGEAVITITASYGDYTESAEISITVTSQNNTEYITVTEAIAAASGTTVTVKGVIGSSIVNQTGFFLIDDTGAIGVLTTADILGTLKLGYEVVIEGTRTVTKDGGGQICISGATVVVNNYGSHEYSTDSFITGKTIAELTAISDSPAATANVYVVSGTFKKVEAQYYSNIYLTDGTNDILLYCNKASQYSFLDAYVGKTVTVEFSLCDWNSKGLKGYVFAVITSDGKVVNSLNFSEN